VWALERMLVPYRMGRSGHKVWVCFYFGEEMLGSFFVEVGRKLFETVRI